MQGSWPYHRIFRAPVPSVVELAVLLQFVSDRGYASSFHRTGVSEGEKRMSILDNSPYLIIIEINTVERDAV